VRESTASHSVTGPQSGYGYLWWTGEGAGLLPNVDEGPAPSWLGYGGHTVIVIPSRNLVVVHRADTDADRMVDEGSIGILLWMILDAVGETGIGDAPLLERAVGTRLTADTLPQVLQACTLRTTQGSAEVIVTFGPGQTISASAYGAVLVETRWWLDGDNYCHDLGPNLAAPVLPVAPERRPACVFRSRWVRVDAVRGCAEIGAALRPAEARLLAPGTGPASRAGTHAPYYKVYFAGDSGAK